MQTYDEYYRNYLNSLVLGAKVYPCYDGKGGRATVCEVIRKSGNTITVKGYFWAEEDIEVIVDFIDGEAWVKYSEEPTVMELLGVTDDDEEGDYYSLIPPDLLKENYTQEYLDCLGLTK
jgi:hypothetical protein